MDSFVCMDKVDINHNLRTASLKNFNDLNRAKGFKVVHLNVLSIVKKIDQIRLLLQGSTIDVLTISETWLRPHLHSNLVNIEGFTVYRLDRGSSCKGKKRGGGLLTYVNDKHSSECESLSELDKSNESIEAQWVYIHRPHCKNVVVCNVYRPPNGDLGKSIAYLDDCLRSVNLGKTDLFLLGDFNVNYKNKASPNYKKLHFFVQSNSLSQLIDTPTRNTDKTKSLIDLVITNSKFVSLSGTLDHFISDHQPIYIIHKKGRDSRQSVKFKGRSYRDFDRNTFGEHLLEGDWGEYFSIEDPDIALEFILDRITKLLDDMCPMRSFHIKNYRPEWMTQELIEQIKDRDYFYKKAKTKNDEDAWNIAKHLRNVMNSNVRQAKREFILSELKENENNSKKFWKVIQEVVPSGKKGSKQDIRLRSNGMEIGKEKVAHFINDYFINVGNVKDPIISNDNAKPIPDLGESLVETLDPCPDSDVLTDPELKMLNKVKEREVHQIVKEINVSKSSGLNDISSFIIKEAFSVLSPEITHMYNLSIVSSKFPAAWKEALVIPIPKSGNLTDVQNYRPISLLPLPGKILEKLVHHQLVDYLEAGNLPTGDQHGFRKGHSTAHSVAQLMNFVNIKMDSRTPTLATYIDFRKAFDCVQHTVLLNKLAGLNLSRSTLEWVESYLSCRKQRVFANNVYSSLLPITQGVPQGSVLGPLFYIIYANDLGKCLTQCKMALYADDTVLYVAEKDFQQSVLKMQTDINSLSDWCTANGIRVNTDKTKVMVFGTPKLIRELPTFEIKSNGTPIQQVSTYKYLGMTLDSNLNYNSHVKKVISTVSGKLKQFQRMRSFLNVRAATLVYKSMILPLLEYGDIFLSATSLMNRKKMQI